MEQDEIDADGYRANVGIILANADGKLLLAGRVGSKGWQFPQGGMLLGESDEQSMYRELYEEIGLNEADVEILGVSSDWIRYQLPERFVRRDRTPLCIGQKQRWFMLRLMADEESLSFDQSETPEFDRWRWVNFWRPVNEVIYFKRRVYALALHELGPCLYPNEVPKKPRWWPKRWTKMFDKDIKRAKKAQANEQLEGFDDSEANND